MRGDREGITVRLTRLSYERNRKNNWDLTAAHVTRVPRLGKLIITVSMKIMMTMTTTTMMMMMTMMMMIVLQAGQGTRETSLLLLPAQQSGPQPQPWGRSGQVQEQ